LRKSLNFFVGPRVATTKGGWLLNKVKKRKDFKENSINLERQWSSPQSFKHQPTLVGGRRRHVFTSTTTVKKGTGEFFRKHRERNGLEIFTTQRGGSRGKKEREAEGGAFCRKFKKNVEKRHRTKSLSR